MGKEILGEQKRMKTEYGWMGGELKQRNNKGQGAMGIVTLAVTIMIGALVLGYVSTSFSNMESMPTAVNDTVTSTMGNAMTGMSLMGVAIIVAAAVFILQIMGSR